MIISRNNRVYTTSGHLFSTVPELKLFVENNETVTRVVHLNQVKFSINDELIFADLGDIKLPFSEHGFKSLCSILKIPFTYLNKLVSTDLILKNINENPNLFKDEFHFYIHESSEKQQYISAVSNCEPITYLQIVDVIEKSEIHNNFNLTLTDLTISNEDVHFYYLTDLHVSFGKDVSMDYGFKISCPEGLDNSAEISPFIRVTFQSNNSFDYTGKPFKK